MASTSFVFYVLLVLGNLVYYGLSETNHRNNTLIVFGDSVFDPGNNDGNNLPYGETYFGYPTGRLSDGRIVPDFIAQYAQLRPLPAFIKQGEHRLTTDGANFASSGATVTVGAIVPFPTQLNYFSNASKLMSHELGKAEAKKVLSRAVYLFSIGGNNYVATCKDNRTKSDRKLFVGWVIAHITSAVEDIYLSGGRKFAFQNVGPLGYAPAFKAFPGFGSRCAQESTLRARLHNRALRIALKHLKSKLPEIKYSVFDFYNTLRNRSINPTKYGFKVGNASCCGVGPFRGGFSCGNKTALYKSCSNPSDYVWFDGGHNTEATNHQLASLMWNGPATVVGPYTVKELFDFE